MKPFNQYKRLFVFGCSMTNYEWPTWADILSTEIQTYYNYGKSGGGNLFIANSLVEANITHKFDKDDLVMVMWSSVSREDRYKNGWVTPGNIYTQDFIEMDFVSKWADTRGYLIRDLALVELTKHYLKNLPCDSDMLAMCKFEDQVLLDDRKENAFNDVLEQYKETIASVQPDIFHTVYKGVWPQTPIRGWGGKGQTADYHPTPIGYYKYLEILYPNLVTEAMKCYAEKYEKLINSISSLDETQEFWSVNGVRRL
jgi:hypothetical protein